MPINKTTKCIICGVLMAGLVASESDVLCRECSEKKQKHIPENGFAHEALFYNFYDTPLTTTSGTFTSNL
ncbi:MAG: hypothetical protein PHZ04_03150 [Patescibacteria group bacterium]|nr:hypothetical protein [Patescibacteria group bacterium]MDD5294758.1 hypothetical protein [Patescibacteria group bacterium]MDD5554699.1 hypothetical protein [Patescibacteria group bacterium]